MEPIDPRLTVKLPPEPAEPPSKPSRSRLLARIRTLLRSRRVRIVFPIATFAAGMVTALLIVVLVFSISKDIAPVSTPGSSQGNIIIQLGPAYITHIVAQALPTAGLPGTIKNVRVTLARGAQMTVDGDDQFSVVGIGFTEHFTVILQPYVQNCQLRIRVLHADLANIPVTGFVSSFESEINQQLQVNSSDFPKGFVYCNTAVRTDPSGLFITYSATPV